MYYYRLYSTSAEGLRISEVSKPFKCIQVVKNIFTLIWKGTKRSDWDKKSSNEFEAVAVFREIGQARIHAGDMNKVNNQHLCVNIMSKRSAGKVVYKIGVEGKEHML